MTATHEIYMMCQNHYPTRPLLPSSVSYNDDDTTSSSSLPISVIVTTESKQIRDEMEQYQMDTTSTAAGIVTGTTQYQFVTNPYDVTQDTGYFDDHTKNMNNTTFTANDIMLSTLSSLQLQLYATHFTVGNCCSNFHLIIKDLLNIGCGVPLPTTTNTITTNNNNIRPYHHHHHQFQCLQNHPNTKYRICCSWDKSSECQNKRRLQKEQQQQPPHNKIEDFLNTSNVPSLSL